MFRRHRVYIDLCASSWIDENDYLGEYVWVKSPLDDVCHRLPLAKVKFKTKGGEFYTKAAVKVNSHPSEPYLLSNHTAELIQSREKSVLMIDEMVTRNASKIVPFEKEREAGLNADPGFPTQGDGTEPTIERSICSAVRRQVSNHVIPSATKAHAYFLP
ncbi:hypothetical protein TNCV_1504171 [Trichonephila clavipes]|uniref:Uncharacterized protein n=1 Tax=Trichonephila clavipes TaxID=2585209 RepID=A0A8X6RWR4_TRICX|nr:hypothetical protein TNCV_1504171 [Trichonephila clavipes]